ncbi:MAG: exonuclease domain-containing protein [Planctomycetaceae bacterium]
MDFVSIDVETANADLASICQIGMVRFKNGQMVDAWQTLLNPEDCFDGINVSIHGIDEDAVSDAPTFRDISETVSRQLSGSVVVSHTAFDRTAIAAVFGKYGLGAPQPVWLDTAKVVRRTWPDCSRRGYGLACVAEMLGIQFQHHNAQEDARAAGEILVRALQLTGMTLAACVESVKRPIGARSGGASARITRDGNPEGSLYGEVVVFTGTLSTTKREAADLAALLGCEVAATVTKSTTLLVVGDQDLRKLAGHEKSAKHRKAETLISKGHTMRILREADFQLLVREHSDSEG